VPVQHSLFEHERADETQEGKLQYKKQLRLIDAAERSGVPLVEALSAESLSYDDLIYELRYKPVPRTQGKRVCLSDLAETPTDIPLASFFTGAGGIDLGFSAAGFLPLVAAEFNGLFAKTLRKNHPDLTVLGPPDHSGDVSRFDEMNSGLRKALGSGKQFDGVFVGGPPCQPFSVAASQRFSKTGDNYKRVGFAHSKNGNLLFDYLTLVEHFRPRAVLVENVPGLASIDGGEQLARAVQQLTSWGYHVASTAVLNAADYEVPQFRKRFFLIAFRSRTAANRFTLPTPRKLHLSVDAALRGISENSENHETRQHSAASIRRYMQLALGERDKLGRVDRLNPYKPSKTIIAGGTKGGGRSHLHPHIPRTMSVRESARLQTFPDEYVFEGPTARQFTQVGNAVPPVLAAHLARAMLDALRGQR
jgi:DNA (cytosine-5)-methyltransferase 1